MSLNCDIVMDCVAIYKDGLASDGTKKAVDTHLKECTDCRKYYKQYDSINNLTMKNHHIEADDPTEKFAAISAAMKARRNFFAACFVIFAAVTVFSVILSIIIGKKSKK